MKNWRISSIRTTAADRTAVLLLLALLTLAAAVLSLSLGAVPISPADVLRGLFGKGGNAIWYASTPRIAWKHSSASFAVKTILSVISDDKTSFETAAPRNEDIDVTNAAAPHI